MKLELKEKVYLEIMTWSVCMPEPIKVDYDIPSMSLIAEVCADVVNIPRDFIYKKTRKRDVVFARQLAHATAHVMRNHGARWGWGEIAYKLGGKYHATAMHSAKTISNNIDTKHRLREIMDVCHYFHLDIKDYKYEPNKERIYGV